MPDADRVQTRIAAIAADLGGSVAVAAHNLASDVSVYVAADDLYPMASCFKIPVMVEVMRQVDAGALRLDERLTLTEADKSPDGALVHLHEGLRPTVRDLLYLMITLSDDTAADMLWRRVGLGTVNDTMRQLGLHTIDCFIPSREYFLIACGAGSQWEGLSGPEMVTQWKDLVARNAHEDALRLVLEENERLTGAACRRLSETCRGRDGELRYDDAFAFDQALDNTGSARDMAELLTQIVEARCASGPSCRLMLEVLSHQEWRDRIPAGLPNGVLVANKTGDVSGTSNDAAVVFTPSGTPVVMVVYCKGLGFVAKRRAPAAIAAIAGALYEYLGEPL